MHVCMDECMHVCMYFCIQTIALGAGTAIGEIPPYFVSRQVCKNAKCEVREDILSEVHVQRAHLAPVSLYVQKLLKV